MADPQPLSLIDADTISEVLLRLVGGYPKLPFKTTQKSIQWQSIDDDESIGLFSMQGAVYLSKYVSGSYEAQFPFVMIYKCKPTNNSSRINKQALLEDLSEWLKTCTATLKDTNIIIESIDRTSNVYKSSADDNGIEQYRCSMTLKYFYKKG